MYSEEPSLRRLNCTEVETGQRRYAPSPRCLIPFSSFIHVYCTERKKVDRKIRMELQIIFFCVCAFSWASQFHLNFTSPRLNKYCWISSALPRVELIFSQIFRILNMLNLTWIWLSHDDDQWTRSSFLLTDSIYPSILWYSNENETAGRSASGQRTSGFSHLSKKSKEFLYMGFTLVNINS